MYSLIISGDSEQWDRTPTEFSRSRYLEHTAPELAARFHLNVPAGARSLLGLPVVFAYEERSNAVARVGYLRSVATEGSFIEIDFVLEPAVPAIALHELFESAVHLDIAPQEPHRTHWAIKDMDLADALETAGLITTEQAAVLRQPVRKRLSTLAGRSAEPPAPLVGERTDWPAAFPMSLDAGRVAQSNLPRWLPVATQGERPSAGKPSGAPDPIAEAVHEALRPTPQPTVAERPRIFVVHGRDATLKAEVALFLARIGLDPIILHEQVNQGRTIIEKFGDLADTVAFAVVLLTPDDVGGLPNEELQPRARQNVWLELGYFIGKLGRDRVCALKVGNVEMASDVLGLLYVSADSTQWKMDLAKELQAAGVPFDAARVLTA